MMRNREWAGIWLAALLFWANHADSQDQAQPAKDSAGDSAAEERIAFLQGKVARYTTHAAGDEKVVYKLTDTLALRWSNPVSGVVDGGIFVWTDGRRPMVIGKCFLNEQKEAWGEAIQSVAPGPLVMKLERREIWKPAAAGVAYHTVKGSAKPAATAGGRLSQLRSLGRRIEVVGIWGQDAPSEWSLRMLTTPVYRYQSEPDRILDGAVFAFTQGGTNPEAIALVELIETDAGPRWQVAVTRLTHYAVRANLDGEVIADLPRIENPAIGETFYHGWHWFLRYPFPKSGSAASESADPQP
jgi:hypothetical protein